MGSAEINSKAIHVVASALPLSTDLRKQRELRSGSLKRTRLWRPYGEQILKLLHSFIKGWPEALVEGGEREV